MQSSAKFLYLTSLMLISGIMTLSAQNESILDSFNGLESNGKVFLNWVITSGKTCDGTRIFRSTDSTIYNQVGEIAGICGSKTSPQPFSFIDENPVKNKTNYYRLELGNIGFSDIVSVVVFDFANMGYLLIPNPASDKAKLLFVNKSNEENRLSVFDRNGALVLTDFTSDNYFEINTKTLVSGLYLFLITKNGSPLRINGRLIVQH